MKKPTFLEGVGVAFGAALVGAVVAGSLGAVYSAGFVLKLVISGLSLAYSVYLLSRSRERVGRVTTFVSWSIGTVLIWMAAGGVPLFLAGHLLMIWLVRSLYFHSSAIPSLVDLGLVGFGLMAAIWAWLETGSAFATFWCFFLVQALFVLIPKRFGRRTSDAGLPNTTTDRFQQAHRAAEAAVAKLSGGR